MLRNVLEIISFSKMNFVSDDRYSFRDLSRGSLYMSNYKSNNVKCGWLKEDEEGNWNILDCGKPVLIRHDDVDKILGTNFKQTFLNSDEITWEKSAEWKYRQIEDKKKLEDSFSCKEYLTAHSKTKKTIAFQDQNGLSGTIVLTGQSGKRKESNDPSKKPSGKVHEFVFFIPKTENYLKILPEQKKDFKFIYLDHDSNNISPDWKYWRSKIKAGKGIPVFYTPSKDGVLHFGLAFMYKLPFKNSIHQLAPLNEYKKEQQDLSEIIFGHANNSPNNSLKGRVIISNAKAIKANQVALQKEIIASPKASFFPNYLEQPREGDPYLTYEDQATISGFKRYPVHDDAYKGIYSEKQKKNPKVFSFFTPLGGKSEFTCKVRFHNLKKIEIGALVSALTFHGEENKCHSLGGAKPFGYGKVSIQLKEAEKWKRFLHNFEIWATSKKEDWLTSPQIMELMAMASNPSDENNLKYPKMEPSNDFVQIKRDKEYLLPYSELNPNVSKIVSQIDKNAPEIKEAEAKRKLEIVASLASQSELEGKFEKFSELSKYVNERFKEMKAFNQLNQNWVISQIKNVYVNHRDSRKKLEKDYDWTNNISNWLGQEHAKELRTELTSNK